MTKNKKTPAIVNSQETFFFTDSDGTEGCSNSKPYRHAMGFWMVEDPNTIVELPKGTIYRIYGTEHKWEDEPICEIINRN